MSASATSPRHVPQRTCIATRNTLPDNQLLRVVAHTREDGILEIIADPQRCRPGRGAWITPTQQAFATAEKRQAFSRALRVNQSADLSPVRDYIDSLAQNAGEVT